MFNVELYLVAMISLIIGYAHGRYDLVKNIKKAYHRYILLRPKWLFFTSDQPKVKWPTPHSLLENDKDIPSNQLTHGRLLRKDGEVDRAISVHQELLNNKTLNHDQINEVRFELAADYLKAGLLDRAEIEFMHLARGNSSFKMQSLKKLLEVYQQQKDWKQALMTLKQIQSLDSQHQHTKWNYIAAHYYCEIAEHLYRHNDDTSKAISYLKNALNLAPCSPRANLLMSQHDLHHQNPDPALSRLKNLIIYQSDFIGDVLKILNNFHEKQQNHPAHINTKNEHASSDLLSFLQDLYAAQPSAILLIAITEMLDQHESNACATRFLKQELAKHPALLSLNKFLQDHCLPTDSQSRDFQSVVRQVIEQLSHTSAHFQCQNCGFKGKERHWLCPGCKQWDQFISIEVYL